MGIILSEVLRTLGVGFTAGFVWGVCCCYEGGLLLRMGWDAICVFFWYVHGRRRAQRYADAYL